MNHRSTLTCAALGLALVACNDGSSDELLAGGGVRARRAAQSKGDDTSDDTESGRSDGTIGGTGASTSTKSGSGSTAPSSPSAPATGVDDDLDAFAKSALSRALEWVDVKMPYCGGVNNGTDHLCGGTCRRSGAHASPAWDPYRTDCSGFVSWAWQLPAPGRITTGFAPFDTSVTTTIDVDDLLPGDALNNQNHVILFGGWANAEHTKARLLEEYDCGQVAVDRVRDIGKVSSTQVSTQGGTFTAIRLDSRVP